MHVSRWAPAALSALIVAATLSPGRALAATDETTNVDLRWDAPDGCPSSDKVLGEIARLLGTSKQHGTVEVEIAVAREGEASLRLHLRMRGMVHGERLFRGEDCGAMARAAALIVAMSIDPDTAARNALAIVDPAPAQPPTPASPRSPSAPAPPASAVAAGAAVAPPRAPRPRPRAAARSVPAAERDLEGTLWLSAQGEQALVPTIGLGIAAGGGIRVAWFRADAALGVVPSSSSRLAGLAAGADFRLWFLEADACGRVLGPPISTYVCVLGRHYWLTATGRSVDEPFSPTAPIFATALGPLVQACIAGPLCVEGALHAVVPLTRPRFFVENLEGTVYRPPAVGVSARLGLALVL